MRTLVEISDTDIQNTILEIFARRRLRQLDVMWLSRLEVFWDETTLRRADLLVGIAQLCSEELLELSDDRPETELWLTAKGEEKAEQLAQTGEGYWRRYLRDELLPAVRWAAHPPRTDGRGRRAFDPYVDSV